MGGRRRSGLVVALSLTLIAAWATMASGSSSSATAGVAHETVYIGTATIVSPVPSTVPPGPIRFVLSPTGREITGVLLAYWYAEPTECQTGIAYGGPGGVALPANVAANGSFSGTAGQGTSAITGHFSDARRKATGTISYRAPNASGSSGCQFQLPFTVVRAPAIPHGRSNLPKRRASYRGRTYQADPISIRISKNGRAITSLKTTASLRCQNPRSQLEHFDFGGPVSGSGHFTYSGSYRDKGARVTVTVGGGFVGARGTASGTLRLRATNLPGSPCDSGPVQFVAPRR